MSFGQHRPRDRWQRVYRTFKAAKQSENFIQGIKRLQEEKTNLLLLKEVNSHNNKYVVLIDPLDGSSNIDVNVSVGTIFSVYTRITPLGTPVTMDDFLQPGTSQVAAGYVIYGTSTMIVYTTGYGVNGFTLNPAIGTFYLSHPNMKFSEDGHILFN
jgi:fructose-1,6-bisphosphatase